VHFVTRKYLRDCNVYHVVDSFNEVIASLGSKIQHRRTASDAKATSTGGKAFSEADKCWNLG
jgi:hypothetical protein